MTRFAVALLVLIVVASVASAEDWPNWRGPTHDGISVEKGWDPAAISDATPAWKASVGQGHSSFAVAKDKVYTMGNTGNQDSVFCFDAATGKEIWKKSYPCGVGNYPGPRATPAVDDGNVYTLSREGHLVCFDADDGKPKWNQKLNVGIPTWGLASSPVVLDDRVIVNAGAAGMAFSKSNGRQAWSGGGGTGGYASVVQMKMGSRSILLIFGEQAFIGVSPSNGRRYFSHPWQTQHNVNAADPLVIDDKHVLIASGYGVGCAMLSVTAQPRVVWQNKNLKAHFSSPVLWKEHIYGFDDSALQCIDAKTGRAKWSERAPAKGGLILADDKLIVQAEGGDLIIADASPDGYKQIARARTGLGHSWTPPVLANGRIYCRDDRGNVVCYNVGAK